MMKNCISKMQQDTCSARNAVPRTNFSEDHLVKPKGIKNGIVATPPFLVSLFSVPDVCQLQDHASLNPVVMVCSCLEITKQEHHTCEPQANNPVDHTFMVCFMPATTSPAFAETLPSLEGMKMEEDAFFVPSPFGQRASQ